MAEDNLTSTRFVRSFDPTCNCGGCQALKCEGKTCAHYGVLPLLKVRVMAKWDNSRFSNKEIRQLKEQPPRITVQSAVSCPCGKFRGKVGELAKEGNELKCPQCGNYNLQAGMLYVRIME